MNEMQPSVLVHECMPLASRGSAPYASPSELSFVAM
jgi:hypothetical protein